MASLCFLFSNVCPAFGAVSTFFGYFLLGPVLFSTAFIIGGGACFVAVRAGFDSSEASAWISVVAMLVGGGLSGFTAVKMLAVGMFAVGATFGVAVSAALKATLWARVFPSSPHAGFLFGSFVLGAIFGMVALTLRKQMLILSTSYSGAFAMLFGIGHFAGHFPTLRQLNQVEQGMFDPWAVLYLGLTALLGTAGMFLQLHLTRDRKMPMRAPYSRYRRHHGVRATSRGSVWSLGDEEDLEHELLPAQAQSKEGSPRAVAMPREVPDEVPSTAVRDAEVGDDGDSVKASNSGSEYWPALSLVTGKASATVKGDFNNRTDKGNAHVVSTSDVDCELGMDSSSDAGASANAELDRESNQADSTLDSTLSQRNRLTSVT